MTTPRDECALVLLWEAHSRFHPGSEQTSTGRHPASIQPLIYCTSRLPGAIHPCFRAGLPPTHRLAEAPAWTTSPVHRHAQLYPDSIRAKRLLCKWEALIGVSKRRYLWGTTDVLTHTQVKHPLACWKRVYPGSARDHRRARTAKRAARLPAPAPGASESLGGAEPPRPGSYARL